MKLQDKTILYFSAVDWNHNWQRQQEFASALAKNNDVLFVTPIGMFNRSIFSIIALVLKRLMGKRTSGTATGKTKPERLHLITFKIIPRHNISFFEKMNKRLLLKQIHKTTKRLGLSGDYVLWTGNPVRTITQLKEPLKPVATIYDNAMRIEKLPDAPSFVLDHEKELVAASDAVFTDNSFKLDQFKAWGANVHKVPQGVDLELFDRHKEHDLPLELRDIEGPVAGYYGSLQKVFDYDLFEKVVKKLPEVTFVCIGPVRDKTYLEPLGKYENFFYIRKQPHDRLPSFLQRFDVALIPYQVNDYTAGTFPTKLFEYLSFLKPVVAEPIEELKHYKDYVRLTDDPDTFASYIQDAIKNGIKDPEALEEFVQHNSWQSRFSMIKSVMESIHE